MAEQGSRMLRTQLASAPRPSTLRHSFAARPPPSRGHVRASRRSTPGTPGGPAADTLAAVHHGFGQRLSLRPEGQGVAPGRVRRAAIHPARAELDGPPEFCRPIPRSEPAANLRHVRVWHGDAERLVLGVCAALHQAQTAVKRLRRDAGHGPVQRQVREVLPGWFHRRHRPDRPD